MPSSLTPGVRTSHVSSVAMPTRPSPRSERLGTPNTPAIRFTRGPFFRGFTGSPLLRPVRLLAPLDGSDRVSPATGGFYIQASDGSVALPVAGYDYNSYWTPLLAGLSPAGMAASLAAPDPSEPNSGTWLLPRVFDGKAHTWPRMQDPWLGKELVRQFRHLHTDRPGSLAASAELPMPECDDVVAECSDRGAVGRHSMVGEIPGNALR